MPGRRGLVWGSLIKPSKYEENILYFKDVDTLLKNIVGLT